MHLKKIALSFAVSAFIIGFSSCKKSTTASSSTTTGTSAQVQADDQTFYTNETNNATDDANAALNSSSSASYDQRPAGVPAPILWPCDTSSVTIDTTHNPRTITINYNGTSCQALFNHKRTGSIVITFYPGFRWGTEGSSITITFNLTVVRVSDGKKIVIAGTRTITNTTAGLLRNLGPSQDSVGYSIADNTTVTFDNGSQRSWNTSLHRTYAYNSTDIVDITTTGSLAGINRFDSSFSADITQPLVVKACSGYRYASGQVSYTGGAGGTSIITFGLDANGDPVSGCTIGLLYYKFVWSGPNGGSFIGTGVY